MTADRSKPLAPRLEDQTALVVGLGGLGCPAALALARAGVGRLVLCDDDIVSLSNLHRQILFSDDDIGKDKLDAAAEALRREGANVVELRRTRLLPNTARALVREADIVLEGADNFATKFLAADACFLERTPIVHGAAVRFGGTAWSVGPEGSPCYRCLFEDLLPDDAAPNCDEAGVMGPVVGVIGALMADLALDILTGDVSRRGEILTFDGKRQKLRAVQVPPRPGCPLCSSGHASIFDTALDRYTASSSCAS